MDPHEYYYKHFRKDFESFWNSAPHRPNYVTGEPIFKFAVLVKRDNFDALQNIDTANLIYFLSALGCTILIDQVIYAYFKEDYPEFQKMTLYPKMEVGWININPWMVFHQNVRLSRNINIGETKEKFTEFARFFCADLKEFFSSNKFKEANWDSIKTAMLNDPEVGDGEFGEAFVDILKNA